MASEATVTVPVKRINNEDWLILGNLSKKGILRAVRIDKRKKPVLKGKCRVDLY